jgi:uncharacterized glyoxalase superfamily protein PhnB
MQNRSVPANVILPHLAYSDVAASIAWLKDVFGFQEHYRYGDPAQPQGAQMHLGDAWIMVTLAREGRGSPAQLGAWTQSLTVFVDDVEAHLAHSRQKGAKIVEDLNRTIYGELQYGVEDLEGHHWLFSRHTSDVAPEEWGAVVAKPLLD